MDVTGKMQMPGEDGKMKDMQFKGMGVEGYDNVKKKFVSSWIDNMGTGIQFSEGTYDPATKTFTLHERNGNDARNENASPRSDKDDRQRSHDCSSGTKPVAARKRKPWKSPTPAPERSSPASTTSCESHDGDVLTLLHFVR